MAQDAPNFRLPDTNGNEISLPQDGIVVLYFYPKADTPGCTKEAKNFTEFYPDFIEAGAQVIGISPDAHSDVCDFDDKYEFSHILLADEDHSVAEDYGVWKPKKMFGKEFLGVKRTTFLIKDGEIINEYKHKPGTTEEEVLADVKGLQ